MRRFSIGPIVAFFLGASACGTSAGVAIGPAGGPVSGREGASSGGMSREAGGGDPIVNAWAQQSESGSVVAGPLFADETTAGSARAPTHIGLNGRVSGHLQSGDTPSGPGSTSVVDEYVFTGMAGQSIVIDVIGGAVDHQPGARLDVMVTLLRGGHVIGSDDDGGGNLNSRLATVLPANGDYVVRVGSYGGQLREGAYTVALTLARQTDL